MSSDWKTGRGGPPNRLDDAEFWRLHTALSEPAGTFRSDNLVSNERGLPEALPEVALYASAGAACIGVGPEQNFSYISALEPRVAFFGAGPGISYSFGSFRGGRTFPTYAESMTAGDALPGLTRYCLAIFCLRKSMKNAQASPRRFSLATGPLSVNSRYRRALTSNRGHAGSPPPLGSPVLA